VPLHCFSTTQITFITYITLEDYIFLLLGQLPADDHTLRLVHKHMVVAVHNRIAVDQMSHRGTHFGGQTDRRDDRSPKHTDHEYTVTDHMHTVPAPDGSAADHTEGIVSRPDGIAADRIEGTVHRRAGNVVEGTVLAVLG